MHSAEPQGTDADHTVGGPIPPGPPTTPGRSGPPDDPLPTGRPVDLAIAVRAAQQGDEDAFRLLFRVVQPGLLRYLRLLVGGGPEDAEDIASETWLQIARDLGGFTGDGDGFRGWAATIARNRALDHLRRVRRRPVADLPVEYLTELAAAEDTAGSALATVATADALALIARLPRDQAEAVLLRVVLDLDAAAAARVLGKRSGSVRMASHRGLRKLAKLLDQAGGADLGIPSRRAVPPQREGGREGDRDADREGDRGGDRDGSPEAGKRDSSKTSAQGVTRARAATLKDMR
ncbi:RNA polymerase sigma factor [Saccharothrix sp. ST-888]|uniref:RNA polymerase sigma factor n=1 Tax=Saccharothrix sp. ST-888 TaxID=1427391 RepID=UPI0018CCEA82|nr:RNA polymerase sigma factor [Saccharothrix sp. ST-888]